MTARPGELLLSAEARSSPKRVGFFTMKLFCGPSEPEASPGEPGIRKMLEITLFPFSFCIFHILDQNIE